MATVQVITETALLHQTTVNAMHTNLVAQTLIPRLATSIALAPSAEVTTTPTAPAPKATNAPTATTTTRKAKAFLDLPTELHLLIFSALDAIDGTCLGLANTQLYATYRIAHPARVSLNQRRLGPNTLESAWEVLGTRRCRFCGIYRCELHMHIREFVPARYEYCHVRQVFGLKPEDGAQEHCYRCCPPKPKQCGRHWLPKADEVGGGGGVEVSKL